MKTIGEEAKILAQKYFESYKKLKDEKNSIIKNPKVFAENDLLRKKLIAKFAVEELMERIRVDEISK